MPYREGRWSWVEPWGWTWVDDQAWGYAPFHYGRWETVTNNRCTSSWAWVPGPVVAQPVWAPALVAFVDGAALDLSQGPNVEAWFPLGPTAPYFPWYHHSDAYLREVNITNLIQVRDVDAVIRDKDLADHRWINRDNALTAVSSAAFGGGDPVGRHAIKLRTDLLPPIRIVQHPAVNPRRELLAGFRRCVAPHLSGSVARRPPFGRRGVACAGSDSEPPAPAPVITRNQPPGQRRTAGGRSASAPRRHTRAARIRVAAPADREKRRAAAAAERGRATIGNASASGTTARTSADRQRAGRPAGCRTTKKFPTIARPLGPPQVNRRVRRRLDPRKAAEGQARPTGQRRRRAWAKA